MSGTYYQQKQNAIVTLIFPKYCKTMVKENQIVSTMVIGFPPGTGY